MSIRGLIIKKQNVIQVSLTSKVQKLKVWDIFEHSRWEFLKHPGKIKQQKVQGQHIPTRSRHLFESFQIFANPDGV